MSTVFKQNDAFSSNDENNELPTPDSYYFRLNKNNLYYTSDSNSIVVLGAISIS